MVAEATGGIAYSETNDLATAVLKAIDNGANYYSIAYVPPDQTNNGAYHKIDVKVDRPGVTVVFRKGYYSDNLAKDKLAPGLTLSVTPPPAYGGNMKAPMSRGFPTSQDILFNVGVAPSTAPPKPGDPQMLGTLNPALQGRRLVRYGFDYVVPAQQIVFTGRPEQNAQGSARLRHCGLRQQRQAADRAEPDCADNAERQHLSARTRTRKRRSGSPSRSTCRRGSYSFALACSTARRIKSARWNCR